MAPASDKGDMGADHVLSRPFALRASPAVAADQPVRDGQFQTLREQWRTMARGQGLKKLIFVTSLAAAGAYYLFLGVLLLVG